MHRSIQTLLVLLSYLELSRSQYYYGSYGLDPQAYSQQGYGSYPSTNLGYDSGYYSPSGYGSYGYSSPLQAKTPDDPNAEAAIKSAMAPLNNIVSSIPALPDPASPVMALMDSRSATGKGTVQQKKSNCTSGCTAARSSEPKQGLNQQTLSQSTQQITQQSSQGLHSLGQGIIHGTQMCQCPCTQGYMGTQTLPYIVPQYPRSGSYYTVVQRARYPSWAQYRPNSYVRPSYYDPNYHRSYYSSRRN